MVILITDFSFLSNIYSICIYQFILWDNIHLELLCRPFNNHFSPFPEKFSNMLLQKSSSSKIPLFFSISTLLGLCSLQVSTFCLFSHLIQALWGSWGQVSSCIIFCFCRCAYTCDKNNRTVWSRNGIITLYCLWQLENHS